jgi:hypothetical protein
MKADLLTQNGCTCSESDHLTSHNRFPGQTKPHVQTSPVNMDPYGMIPMLTPVSQGTGASEICCALPDSQTKAERFESTSAEILHYIKAFIYLLFIITKAMLGKSLKKSN